MPIVAKKLIEIAIAEAILNAEVNKDVAIKVAAGKIIGILTYVDAESGAIVQKGLSEDEVYAPSA